MTPESQTPSGRPPDRQRKAFRGAVHVGLTALLLVAPLTPAFASVPTATFEGGGWGHGVGMSQYGARGQAQAGRSYTQILQHYFTGVTVGPIATISQNSPAYSYPEAIWVGFLEKVAHFQFTVDLGGSELCRRDGAECFGDLLYPLPGETWRIEVVGPSSCIVKLGSEQLGEPGPCDLDLRLNGDRVNFSQTPSPRKVGHGTVRVRQVNNDPSKLHVVVSMEMEDYLKGLNEMPNSWHVEALKAQAVAARSYAVVKMHMREQNVARLAPDQPVFTVTWLNSCACHVRHTTSDQAYSGWQHSQSATNWTGAVTATAGVVMGHTQNHYRGVADGFYSSSTGGVTDTPMGGFGGNSHAYLQSVDDHWAVLPSVGNPYATWSKSVTESVILSKLAASATPAGWRKQYDWLTGVEVVNGPPGARVKFSGVKDGVASSVEAPGYWVRSAFELRSPQIAAVSWNGRPREAGDEFLFYRSNGAFKYVETNPNGSPGWLINSGTNYTTGWSVITALDLDGDGKEEVLFYKPNGTYEFRRVDENGILGATIRSGTDFTKNWTSITAVDLNGDGIDELMFYRADGLFRFYRTNPNGTIGSPLAAGSNYTKNWTSISALDLNGDGKDELFFYRTDGVFRFYKPKSDGSLPAAFQAGSSYSSGWTSITGVDLDGDGKDEMFFYRADGLYRFYKPRPDGSLPGPLASGSNYETGWSSITAVNIDGH